MSQQNWRIPASFYLDSGTTHFSGGRMKHPDYLYSDWVLNWGSVTLTMAVPPGPPQVSEARIRVRDNAQLRALLRSQPSRRRIVDLQEPVRAGDSISATPVFYSGEVKDPLFSNGVIELPLRDRLFAWLDEPLPSILTAELFPDIDPKNEGGFLPFFFGECRSTNGKGYAKLPHFGLIGSPPTVDRYGLCVSQIQGLVNVYRRAQQLEGEARGDEWEIVDPSEYEVNQDIITAFGLTFEVNWLDFYLDQAGAEIRVDIDGVSYRGVWGTLPEESGYALRNPIDTLINLTYFAMVKAGVSVDVFDTDGISALHPQFATMFSASPPDGYKFDWSITEPLTPRECLGQILPCCALDMTLTKGKITFRLDGETDPDRPVFSDRPVMVGENRVLDKILLNSYSERLPDPVVTQVVYKTGFNPADNEFETVSTYNTDELDLLGEPSKEVLELKGVRDAATALDVVERRSHWRRLGSYRQRFSIPLLNNIQNVELCKLVGITHRRGLAEVGGYNNREAKIVGMTLDLDGKTITLDTILKTPATLLTRFRPDIEVVPSQPEYDPYSSVDNGSNFVDSDSYDDPATFATFTINHTSPLATYWQAVLNGFPEPDSGRTLSSVRIAVVLEYIRGAGTVILDQHPASFVKIKDHYPLSLAEPATSVWENGVVSESKAQHNLDFSAAAFASAFPGGAADIHLHIAQWSTLNSSTLGGFEPHIMKCYDAWIEYFYAD